MKKTIYIEKPSRTTDVLGVLLICVFILGNMLSPYAIELMYRLILIPFVLMFFLSNDYVSEKTQVIFTITNTVLLGILTFYKADINYYLLFLLCLFIIFKIGRKYEVIKFRSYDDDYNEVIT